MSKLILISFFFILSCSNPQSKVFPDHEFSRLNRGEAFSPEGLDQQTATSVMARVTLSKLLAKHIVNLSTVFLPPDSFRIDIFSAGLPKLLFLVARDQQTVQLVVPSENSVFLGDAKSRPLDRILGFPLPELFLLNLLLGKSDLPNKLEYIEHSRRSIFRVEFKEDAGFSYRLYFEKIGCLEKDISAEKFKLSGLEVLSQEGEYLFFAKASFDQEVKNCSTLFPNQISFENFNTRFSGRIDNISVRSNLVFSPAESSRLFSPAFPGYSVRPLAGAEVGKEEK